MVQVAVLGPLAAIALTCVLLWLLSRLGLLDHDGWVLRAQQETTPDPRRVPAATYRPLPLHEAVARANHNAVAGVVCPLTHLPVSPDPRRKES